MHGYTGAMVELARYCQEMNFYIHPDAVSVISSPLLKGDRERVEEAFGCALYNVYGSNEAGHIAIQCKHRIDALHVLSDRVHVDILDDDGKAIYDDKNGRVAFTTFLNRLMPFVKYELGDFSHHIKASCPCGLPFPLIASIRGRETDYLEDVNRNKVFGLNATFDLYPKGVRAYQYRQHTPGDVTLLVVPDKAYPNAINEIQEVYGDWRKSLAGRIDLKLKIVDEIPHDGGKIRFIVYE